MIALAMSRAGVKREAKILKIGHVERKTVHQSQLAAALVRLNANCVRAQIELFSNNL